MNCNWKYALGLLFVVFTFITLLAIFLTTGSSESNGGANGKSETRRATNLEFSESEMRAKVYVNNLNEKLTKECERHAEVVWNYKLHVPGTNNSVQVFLDSLAHRQRYTGALLQNDVNLKEIGVDWQSYLNETLKTQVHQLLVSGAAVAVREQSDPSAAHWLRLAEFEEAYRKRITRVVEPLLQQVSDYEYEEERQGGPQPSNYHSRIELNKKLWMQFHNEQGQFVKNTIYSEAVQILRQELYGNNGNGNGIKKTGLDLDTGTVTATAAEEEFTTFSSYYHSMQSELDAILEKIRPLYTLLHSYVRGTSRDIQKAAAGGHALIAANGSIPIHLISAFGNWFHYKDDGAPFDQIQMGHITYNIMFKELTPRKLLDRVNELFLSLNLTTGDNKGFPDAFWLQSVLSQRSVLEDTNEYESICDDVLDVCRPDNYKTMFCDVVSYENFRDFHIKLGTIKYMMMAKPGLSLSERGINPILLHANSMVWNLLAASPRYIDSLNLWQHVDWPREESLPHDITATLNFQYNQALAILPRMVEFISQQKWLSSVLTRKSSLNTSNCEYWRWREELEGVQPPEMRRSSQLDGFQAFKNLRKSYEAFIGEIIGFQLHKTVCTAAGEYMTPDSYFASSSTSSSKNSTGKAGPVYKTLQQCDITSNISASKLLVEFMQLDTTEPLREVLFRITGSDKISVDALLDYFEPLYHFLSSSNFESKYPIGWDSSVNNNYESCL